MPSKSPEQKRFMQAVANNPKFAKKVKVPVNVGKEFVKADKAQKEQMMKKAKRYEEGGYLLDSEGNRVKSGSGDDIRTGSYDADADMESARKQLAQDVQDKLKADKAKDDADFAAEEARSKTARAVSGAASKAAPTKKSSVVTKEELAKSGLSLRDYMNQQKGLTRRDGKAVEKASAKAQSDSKAASSPASRARPTPEGSSPKQTFSGNYSNEGRSRPAPAKKSELGPLAAGRYSPGYAKQLEQTEQKRIGRLEQEKIRDAKREAELKKFNEAVKNDPKQKELKADKEKNERMSPAERSAARGKGIKEFFGLAKGGSVRGSGIAQRGVRKCKIV